MGGCLYPISSRAWRDGMACLQFMNSDISSASAADDMMALTILEILNTTPLLGGNAVLLDIKKCLPALIQAYVSERYEAYLWPARNISLAWYVMTEYGCEAS